MWRRGPHDKRMNRRGRKKVNDLICIAELKIFQESEKVRPEQTWQTFAAEDVSTMQT